ncbi:hypothetical protein PAPHI01_1336 [Pancytospora philotis]|nr:hypothetical protein PAPHI01_1336 [Pancytospora philotis]
MASAADKEEASREEEYSSTSWELVVDKAENEEAVAELAQDNNLYDYDPETTKDKPWLKPGADITDYFNYGFTEQTWKKYCEMQRENREWTGRQKKNDSRGGDDRAYGRKRHTDGNAGSKRYDNYH